MVKSVTWTEPYWACMSLAESKTEGKTRQEQAETEVSCSKGLVEYQPTSGDVYGFQTSRLNLKI